MAPPELAAAGRSGLSSAEAAARLVADGPNELPAPPRTTLPRRIVTHLAEPLSLVLLAAAITSGVVLRHVTEALTIAAIVVLNAGIGVLQEHRADAAVAALHALTAPTARVRRDGASMVVPARDVVVGDVVELVAGDRIPADVALIDSATFATDEALLTGESLPVAKDHRSESDAAAFAGTMAVRGSAAGVVTATGAVSQLGRIAAALGTPSTPPLVLELRGVAARLSIAAIVLGAALIPIAYLRREEDGLGEAVLAGVALAIAAIPEGLAAVVTTALALGARRMAARGAIVRRLASIETLGATSVLCSDKTGTLTTGRVEVVETVPLGAEAELWRAALRCIDGGDDHGDPIDVAIRRAARAAGFVPGDMARREVAPFDATTRSMTTVVEIDGTAVVTVKGAPEVVLARCRPGDDVDRLAAETTALSARALRVLAVASAPGSDLDAMGLVPVGLLAFADPLRDSAADAVAACRAAGIRIVLVTGDHADTARAIAGRAGLDPDPVIAGDQLVGLDDEARHNRLRAAAVVARVDPHVKVELVEAHRAAGAVVAMTGDGVNDAPALRAAHVGVAVAGDEGTDVARGAADVVLTTGDLGTIVEAIRNGRRAFANVATVTRYLVTGNLSEIMTVAGAIVLLPELAVPLLPVQLLWLNLVTDGLPAIALGVDDGIGDPMRRRPRPLGARLLAGRAVVALAGRSVLVAGAALGAGLVARRWGWESEAVRSQLLLTLIVGHLLLAYTARSLRWSFERGWAAYRPLLGAIGGSLALQLPVFATPLGRDVFEVAALDPAGWLLAGIAAFVAVAMIDLGRVVVAWRRR